MDGRRAGDTVIRRSVVAASAATLLVLLPVAGAEPPAGGSGDSFMRGMVVSCPTWGPVWGSPLMSDALTELAALGVGWVAIHPYAGVRRDGSVRFTPAAETGFLAGAAQRTRAAGMRLFWKPHLAYWGSFEWRGAIAFGADEAAWRRFFDGYREFIVDQASFAESVGAELLAVGVEYEATTHREDEWRRIIAAVRRVYSGRLTYAANWDTLGRVGFWDALDLIGVHGYFPLTDDDRPNAETLRRAWDGPLAELGRLSETHGGLPVVFAEIGYSRSSDAARRPWIRQFEDTADSRELRRRLMEAALDRLEREPLVRGLFWWKWMPGGRGERDFSMRDPEARAVLASRWGPAVASGR